MTIRQIQEEDFERIHAMQCTFLDVEDHGAFRRRVQRDPEFYLVALDGEKLAGICYGRMKEPPGCAGLDGICVDLNSGYERMGIGSALLEAFEGVLRKRGCQAYDVGSAPDPKVESFYLKNGFYPIQLVARKKDGSELTRVEVKDYSQGQQRRAELHKQFNPDEVIFIFKKDL